MSLPEREDDPRAERRSSDDPQAAQGSGHSILDEIALRTGRVTRTSLDETDDDPSPIVDPRVESFQEQLRGDDRGKYRVVGEIASGGMGVVLRSHDGELGRDVAMKVIHAELAGRPEVIERFVEEAQIGGQLQHPGIVPVYELGLMSDERPYFTMKLVKGHTLAKLLARRKDPHEGSARFLSIFESVCQTMAYAHSKGVIHRDLKPANVMVGGFGEVQVVDWGLSKVLRRGGVADELAARDPALSVIETVRSGPASGSDSLAGNVLGTPAYMPPEQARGEIEQLDERSDVFALGAILCELLTGAPPYVEHDGKGLVQQAASAELAQARERLEASRAHATLKALCLACLSPAKNARPATAEEVAEAVREHVAGLESAAHEAQLAAAEQRLAAQRSRAQLLLGLSAAVILLLSGGGWWWFDSREEARVAEIERGFEAARDEVLEHERAGAFLQALESARAGLRLVESGAVEGPLLDRARSLVQRSEAAWNTALEREAQAQRDARLLAFLTDVEMRAVETGFSDTAAEIDAEYRAAFRDYGIEIDRGDAALVERIEALRDAEMALAVALGADGWTRLLRQELPGRSVDIDALTSIALDLDPDPLRAEIRLAMSEGDAARLLECARTLPEGLPPETQVLLASSLFSLRERTAARAVAVRGADRHPSDFLLNYMAGYLLDRLDPTARFAEPDVHTTAAHYLRAALALRPDLAATYTRLNDHYRRTGNYLLAAEFAVRAVQSAPDHSWNWAVLAFDLRMLGRYEEAIERFEQAERDYPLTDDEQAMLRECRIATGELTPEELLAWTGTRRSADPAIWATPAALYILGDFGLPADPRRALELLEPFVEADGDEFFPWLLVTEAHVLLGDGDSALRSAARAERELQLRNLHGLAALRLLQAAALRLLDSDQEADLRLAEARHARDNLVAGHEPGWEGSVLTAIFRRFEPLARR